MKTTRYLPALAVATTLVAAVAFPQHPAPQAQSDRAPAGAASHGAPALAGPAVIHPEEMHFRNLRQITFGGQNAEGYWSPDGKSIIYQRMNEAEGVMCDQAYVADLATGASRRVSNGKGRVTCGYFTDGGRRVLYAS
ncbi:MAG TPA: hypothetical protein VJ648_05325, partial [Vicinamibacteria bacterium]|nr:hypothetical protein [Vicinamibacteria bacterium]